MAFYGDDFTGSTDALEQLTLGGVETVLFTQPLTDAMLKRYPQVRAIGMAGKSRAMTPDEMELALPAAYESLRKLQPKIVHYKTCSTFDSSPTIGSIGRAIEIACRTFQNRITPVVVGTPALGRYFVFGNLFARSGLGSEPFRLDRHPSMSRHPTTPMTEADLRVHLSRQTNRPIALVDVVTLDAGFEAVMAQLATLAADQNYVVLFDTLTDAHLATIGKVISRLQEQEGKPLFVAGSSGIERALAKHWSDPAWAQMDASKAVRLQNDRVHAVDQTVAVSGSCSPVTERQIAWALQNGFAEVALETAKFVKSAGLNKNLEEIVTQIMAQLSAGKSVVVHTSRGPQDPRIAATRSAMGSNTAAAPGTTARELGVILGRILDVVLSRSSIQRVAVVGGDTSGFVAETLGIESLEMIEPLTPGSPLCLARGGGRAIDGVEITFKGGQVGHENFFGSLLGKNRE